MQVSCSNCGKVYQKIPPKLSGKKFRCRECQAAVQVPLADSLDDRRDELDSPAPASKRHVKPLGRPTATGRPVKKATGPAKEPSKAKPLKWKQRPKKTLAEFFAEEWSLKRVYVALCIALALFGWSLMAGRYAKDIEGWIPGLIDVLEPRHGHPDEVQVLIHPKKIPGDYVKNAIVKIPSAPRVLWHGFTVAWHIPVRIVIGMAVLGGLVYWASKLQKKFDEEDKRRRRAGI
jgi:hypothetical protein